MEAMLEPPRTGMQVFEMLPQGTRCQLINDTIVISPASLMDHQDLSRSIFKAIDRKALFK